MTQSAGKDGERELANRLADLDSLSTQLTDSWYSRARKAEIERAAAMAELQEAEERWNSHSCTQKLQGLELVQARSERDAAIERANEAERIGAEDEESLVRSRNEADRLAAELRQAIERSEKLEKELRQRDHDDENWKLTFQDELARSELDRRSLRSTITQKDEEIERLEAALHSIAEPGSVALDTIEDDGLIVTTQELQRCKRVARNALSTPETGETDG